MKLCKFIDRAGHHCIGRIDHDQVLPLSLAGGQYRSLFDILEADDPNEVVQFLTDRTTKAIPLDETHLLPPIDEQEVWAAGVTYKRSQVARMEESEHAASAYDRVYNSPRPELFFKATPHRVAGPDAPLRIRADSKWNVPEPELTLVLTSKLKLVGFTIGNDMSSRDIEGENPLYLPQAKVYDGCCGLGPCIWVPTGMPERETLKIKLHIVRAGKLVFQGQTSAAEMARSFEELISWLGRDNSFPRGAFLLTGTGVVPGDEFTLHAGDVVEITIDRIGTLSNPIVQG